MEKKKMMKTLIAGAIAAAALGFTAASAAHKPDYCARDHDHRSHAADYYSYYPADKYFRAGAYRDGGVSISVSFGDRDRRDYGDRDRYDDHRYGDRRYGDRDHRRGRDGRVVNREVYDTRYRARIVLVEEVVRTRRGPQLICTVDARGPEARYVPDKRLRKVARRECSPRAQIRIVT
ncbi:MAG: hypothetical protein R3C58_05135 [Parvularculaceae bacterium]